MITRIYLVSVTITLILVGFLYHNKCSDYSKLNTKYELAQIEVYKAKSAIQTQNEAIESYRIDLEKIQSIIKQKEQELSEARLEKEALINEELAKDNSTDNQLRIVNRILHDFAN